MTGDNKIFEKNTKNTNQHLDDSSNTNEDDSESSQNQNSSKSDGNVEKNYTNTDTELNNKPEQNNNILCHRTLCIFICFIFIAVVATYCIYCTNNKNISISELPTLTDHLYSLDKDFPKQPLSLWTTIVSGIKDFYTRKPQQPCIILLFGEVDTKETAECLVHEVAYRVIRDMHSGKIKPAFVEAATIQSNDYGEVQEDLRAKIASQKVLIIKNLQDMEGSIAQSLHALCDRYNPAVSDALILFTLHGKPTSGNAADMAQQLLKKIWKTQVQEDKLPALITRITSRVIAVLRESNLPEKCVLSSKNVNKSEL